MYRCRGLPLIQTKRDRHTTLTADVLAERWQGNHSVPIGALRRRQAMWVRKRLDIGWADLACGFVRSWISTSRDDLIERIEQAWSPAGEALACLSVRTGFDLLLASLRLPKHSEVLLSAVTIPDMVRIIEHHGLVPVPVDVEAGRMAPSLEALRGAITPRTRVLVVAHLFGGRVTMEPILEFAAQHGLFVIEDCAQAFDGEYRGHARSDAAMFSFGPIKTATALGGAVVRVRDQVLLDRAHRQQSGYRVQSRWFYLRRVLKYSALKAFSPRPMYRLVLWGCRLAGRDHDIVINDAVRGFAGDDFFGRIRQQPSDPLLAVLSRRLHTYSRRRLQGRAAKGNWLVDSLRGVLALPGADAQPHNHWVMPVLVDDPPRAIAVLRNAGFDATQGQSLCVVSPPTDRPELEPTTARETLGRIVFLPFYPELTWRALRAMSRVLAAEVASRSKPAIKRAAPPLAAAVEESR